MTEEELKKKINVVILRAARAGAHSVQWDLLCLERYNYFELLSDRAIEYQLDEFNREIDDVIKEKQ